MMSKRVRSSLLKKMGETPFPLHFSIFDDTTKHLTLTSDFTAEMILHSIQHGKQVIFDGDTQQHQELFQKISRQQKEGAFFLCFTNDHFFRLDVVQMIKGYLQESYLNYKDQPTFIDRILTASQEAFSNAFLWSSLELESTPKIRPPEFYEQLEERLKDPFYKNRVMSIYFTLKSTFFELGIDILGKPIHWPEDNASEAFRGTSLIMDLTDQVAIDADKKGIRLLFDLPPCGLIEHR